ncbi:MAG TPA: 3-oxoacyl-[acyl-carrier-protein] reductase [bacterium]
MEGTGSKVALVTGGAQGIGRAIAMALARAGADVAVCDLNPEGVAAARAELEATGRRAWGFTGDVSSLAFAQEAVEKTVAAAGALHVLVNNAGITRDGLLMRMKPEDWDAVLRVNLTGAFNFCKAAVPGMIKQRWGRIVNISSVVGAMGNAGQVNYAASKAGLLGLTKSLAREVASRGVTVNAVAPGFIDTAMTQAIPEKAREALLAQIPAGRLGQAADVAAAVRFLAGEEAGYITGQVIHVNGGMYT